MRPILTVSRHERGQNSALWSRYRSAPRGSAYTRCVACRAGRAITDGSIGNQSAHPLVRALTMYIYITADVANIENLNYLQCSWGASSHLLQPSRLRIRPSRFGEETRSIERCQGPRGFRRTYWSQSHEQRPRTAKLSATSLQRLDSRVFI